MSELTQEKKALDATRADLAETLAVLEKKLSSGELRDQIAAELKHVEERTRAVIGDELNEAKRLLREELDVLEGKTKQGLSDAGAAIKSSLAEAKEAVKKDLKEAFTNAKQSVRAATVGRVEELATTIGDKMNDTRETLIDTVRQNPIPTALVGIGLAWLLMNRSKGGAGRRRAREARSYVVPGGEDGKAGGKSTLEEAEESVSQVAQKAGDTASDLLHKASGAVGSAAQSASGLASRIAGQTADVAKTIAQGTKSAAVKLGQQVGGAYTVAAGGVRKGVERVGDQYRSTLEENPLAIAGVALVLGALVGFALPRSRREDELMGRSRDRLLRRAGEAAQGAASSIADLAEDALDKSTKPGSGPTVRA